MVAMLDNYEGHIFGMLTYLSVVFDYAFYCRLALAYLFKLVDCKAFYFAFYFFLSFLLGLSLIWVK